MFSVFLIRSSLFLAVPSSSLSHTSLFPLHHLHQLRHHPFYLTLLLKRSLIDPKFTAKQHPAKIFKSITAGSIGLFFKNIPVWKFSRHHLRSLSTLFKPQKRIAKTNHSILTIRFHHFLLYYYSLLPKLIRILHSLYIHFHTKLHLISVLPSLSLLQPPRRHQLAMGIIRIHREPNLGVTTHRCVVLQTSSFFIRCHHITLIFSRFMIPNPAPIITEPNFLLQIYKYYFISATVLMIFLVSGDVQILFPLFKVLNFIIRAIQVNT